MSDARVAVRWRVTGRVQGVWYRAFTRERARELGLDGWVRNEPDGSVEVHVAGPADAVEQLRARLACGPPHARVDAVEELPLAEEPDWRGFDVRR